jgi:hypothetical protein
LYFFSGTPVLRAAAGVELDAINVMVLMGCDCGRVLLDAVALTAARGGVKACWWWAWWWVLNDSCDFRSLHEWHDNTGTAGE